MFSNRVCVCLKFLSLPFNKLGLSVKCLWNVIVSLAFCFSVFDTVRWCRQRHYSVYMCVCVCLLFFCSSFSFLILFFHFNKGQKNRHKTNLNYCRYFCRALLLLWLLVLLLLLLLYWNFAFFPTRIVLWLLANIWDNQNGKRRKIVCTKA